MADSTTLNDPRQGRGYKPPASTLGQSLGTAKLPVKAPVSKPTFVLAPDTLAYNQQQSLNKQLDQNRTEGMVAPVAPAPAAAPAAPASPDDIYKTIGQGLAAKTSEEARNVLGQAYEADAKAKGELAAEQQKQDALAKRREADLAQSNADKVRDITNKQQKILDGEYGHFAPTRETAGDIMGLFSMLTIATMGAGTSGKYSGMNAMSALSGAMKGYKEGREDVYKKEMDSYNKNLEAFTKHQQNQLKQMDLALKELSTDKDAAMARLKQVAAENAGGIVALQIRSGNIDGAMKHLETQVKTLETAEEKAAALAEKKSEFERTRTFQQSVQEQLTAFRTAQLGQGQQRINIQLGKADEKKANIPDAVTYVKKFTGSNIDKKVAPEVLISAGAVGDAYGLKAEIEKHPEWVGRTGQIKNFFNRTIESLNIGTAAPEDNNQPELVFAKQYAEYLVNYERSLVGGAKGFTVAFQNRFNRLLEQNQFNAAGFGALMDEQIRTIINKTAAIAPSVNKKNLTEMALDIKTRAGEDDIADAIRAYSSGKPVAPAPAEGGLTQAEKDKLPPNPNRAFIGQEPIIPNKDNTGWVYEKTGKAVK
jgi:hypothetical protein